MRHLLLSTTAACLALATLTPFAVAGEAEDRVIAKVIEGYGGAKFENLKSITITSDLRYGWLGQGQTPEYVDLEPMTKIYHIDLAGQRGVEEAWGGRGSYAERVITTADGQKTINYIDKTYSHNPEAGFYDHFGGEIRTSDTLLAYDLMTHRESAKVTGEASYWGVPHDLITFDMPGTTIDPVLWVNRETGHITKMRRDVDVFVFNYVFGEFRQSGGITYADDFILYADNDIIEYAKSRSVKPGRVKESEFEVPSGMRPEPDTVDREEMRADLVTGSTFLAGQNYGYSMFVDAGDYLIGTGGTEGLKARYDAYIARHGEKPLKYQIVTHHHLDHVQGMADALELGAILVTPVSATANLAVANGGVIDASRLQIIEGDKVSLGPVDIHMISTAHALDYALVYVPRSKTVFQADHYNGNNKDGASTVNHFAMSLKDEIDRLGLDVEFMLSAHAPKIEKWPDFNKMAKLHVPGPCPANRKICSSK